MASNGVMGNIYVYSYITVNVYIATNVRLRAMLTKRLRGSPLAYVVNMFARPETA